MKLSQIQISVELRLLAILSRPILNELHIQEASTLIPSVEIARFRKLLDHHRVWPCVHCNIRDHFSTYFDQALISYLEKKYKKNIDQSKKQFMAYGEILCAFKQAGIVVRTLKGIPLAKRLYGDQIKRSSRDIDLLIPMGSFALAHSTLCDIGFKAKQYDELSSGQQGEFFSCLKDVSYLNRDGVLLELHVRLCEHETVLSKELTERLIRSEEKNDTDELIYLSWHGAHSLFHRIKWVLDIALYIDKYFLDSDVDLDELLAAADKHDEARSLMLAMVLAHVLYGVVLPDRVMKRCTSDKALLFLLRMSLKTIESPERYFTVKSTFEAYLCEFLLPKRYVTKFKVLVKNWKPNPHDRVFFSYIPDKFYWALVLLRPFRLVYMRTLGRSKVVGVQ